MNRRAFAKAIGLGAAAVVPMVAPGTHTSFGRLKHVRAGLPDVSYAEAGPRAARSGAYPAAGIRRSAAPVRVRGARGRSHRRTSRSG